ncbi:hypothetical protein [Streptomyces atratus]
MSHTRRACGASAGRRVRPGLRLHHDRGLDRRTVPVALSLTWPAPGPVEEAWREAPVACTLGGAELGERTEQWRTLVAKADRREDIEDGLRLSFSPDAELAAQVPTEELAAAA